ncbi:hypothetical protein N4T57_06180 [Campylobacter hepaticus]|uniref:Uncharacterized protein n=1 Tax=Campylobacter hepaticus TaxID=1813019 RepID=A0A6A7JT52_9BACT|nr:hypothetical protein [Campylobacter hepaticus]AXP08186.1 hypothetical protein A2J15_000205 [Campylobacter hepaticus]MCZ0772718.1 hypothetical protein [Campylobacter hepaticus]MCZ0774186.1 hypothetical protein [Campylobacter hepaticus]MCZ0775438.1 hypothetical protein [Campylobacter hepaticus]MDX2323804.1 hypothetical protein [Campylobacter hepaticus]
MTYSFIQPKKKPIFKLFDKIWLGLFSFSILFILLVYFIYTTKTALIHNTIYNEKQQVITLQNKIQQNNALYATLLEQSQIAKNFTTQNQILKESLKNLFDIIVKTDNITLQSMEQEKYSLKLIGITPTKEMFSLLLETPLKSIFDQSNTSYYRLDNGWYRFVNISKKFQEL